MPTWSEDFSGFSLEQILQEQIRNRAWGKELRDLNDALVNSRLAKQMSQADYLTDRNLVREAALECKRRASVLDAQTRPLSNFSLTAKPAL
jgi:hypothetical protein